MTNAHDAPDGPPQPARALPDPFHLDAAAMLAGALYRQGVTVTSLSAAAEYDADALIYTIRFDVSLPNGHTYQQTHRVDELVALGNMDGGWYHRVARDIAALTR